MKKVLLTFVLLVGIAAGLFAQKLTYQAAIRDNNRQLVTNTAVKATVTIDFAAGEDPTWTVDATTNLHGLLTFEFGDDALLGRDWTDATIAVRVVNADDESTVYVGGDARSVSVVPYALSVDGKSIQNYLDEKHYVDLAKLNDTLGKYPTTAAMDARHYLTSDSAAITTMKGNITANATNITSLQGNLSAAINKEKADSTILAGRIDALENASMDCNDVKNCIKDTLGSYTTTADLTVLLQQLTARLDDHDTKIDSLAHMVDSLAKLPHGGDTTEVADGEPCPGAATVSDIDGNTYNTVKIGNQCWMKENLRTSTETKGIGNIYTPTTEDVPGYDVAIYGRLYDWYAVMQGKASSMNTPSNVQGICPTGWHVPSDAEWDALTYYVFNNTSPDYKCGSSCGSWTAQSNVSCIANALSGGTWEDPNDCGAGHSSSATFNRTGFSAVPAGGCFSDTFANFGERAYFWSATQDEDGSAWYRRLDGFDSGVCRFSDNKDYGFPVRCLKDAEAPAAMTVTTDSANTVTNNSAKLHGNVTDMGGKTEVNAGFKYGTSEGALTSIAADEFAMYGTGKFNYTITGLTPNTQYYFKAFAANGTDTVYGEVKNFTTTGSSFTCGTSKVKDVDNNEYNTVQIGNQCWMMENLRTTRYADGTSIELGTSTSTTTAYRYYPNNDSGNVNTYGYLYNWKAVMRNSSSSSAKPSGVQGICPTGWHVPSDDEWTALTDYVKGKTEYQCGEDANNNANALSAATGWNNSSTAGCNAGNSSTTLNKTGFSAVPAGYYDGYYYYYFGDAAHFWSATQSGYYDAYYRTLIYLHAYVSRNDNVKCRGFSVRCLRDAEAPAVMTVTTDSANTVTNSGAKLHGNVTDMGGKTEVKAGFKYGTSEVALTSIAADESAMYGTGKFNYTITGLAANTQYYYKAFAANGTDTVYGEVKDFTTTGSSFTCGTSKVKDVDNNEYNTVLIGNQCWMKENLRTTKKPNGDGITSGMWNPGGNSVETYGRLYSWTTMMNGAISSNTNPSGVQGICPEGWHVPSDAEWDTLTKYVFNSTSPDYKCGDYCDTWRAQSYVYCIANALSSTTGWSCDNNSDCDAGNTGEKSNLTDFSAVPAGYFFVDGLEDFSRCAYFWSATDYEDNDSWAYYRSLDCYVSYVTREPKDIARGLSVRCLRN